MNPIIPTRPWEVYVCVDVANLLCITHCKQTLRRKEKRDVLVDLSLTLTRSKRETKLTLGVRDGHESLDDCALPLLLCQCLCLCRSTHGSNAQTGCEE